MRRTITILAAVVFVLLSTAGRPHAETPSEEAARLVMEYVLPATEPKRRTEIATLLRKITLTNYRKHLLAGLKSEMDVDRTLELMTTLRLKGFFKEVRKLYEGNKKEAALKFFMRSRDPECQGYVHTCWLDAAVPSPDFTALTAALRSDCIPVAMTEKFRNTTNDVARGAAAQSIVLWQFGLNESDAPRMIAGFTPMKEQFALESRTSPVNGEPLLDTGTWSFTSTVQVGENFRVAPSGIASCIAFPVSAGERTLEIKARVTTSAGRGATVRLGFGDASAPSSTVGVRATLQDWELEQPDPLNIPKSPMTQRQWIELRWLMERDKKDACWRMAFYANNVNLFQGRVIKELPTSLTFEGGQCYLLFGSIDYLIAKK